MVTHLKYTINFGEVYIKNLYDLTDFLSVGVIQKCKDEFEDKD